MAYTAIEDIDTLAALYGEPHPLAIGKVSRTLTPLYRQYIEASRFLILSTVGPEGTDASPRGDDGPVVEILDDQTVLLPDWRGNNRTDSLRNIVRDGRVSLMFMVPGCGSVVRLNGQAYLSADKDATSRFEQKGKHPRSVVLFTLLEAYYQCPKALMRSGLWTLGDQSHLVPTADQFLKEQNKDFDGDGWDRDYAKNAQPKMW